MFLYNENPSVKFQTPESCPNGRCSIKWPLRLCQWSGYCRPLQFGSLQRNRMRYLIKCRIFCCKSLGFVNCSEVTMQSTGLSVLVLSTGGQSAITSCYLNWQWCWAGRNLPNVPSREGKTKLPFPQQSSEI